MTAGAIKMIQHLTSEMEKAYASNNDSVGNAYLARLSAYKAQFARAGIIII